MKNNRMTLPIFTPLKRKLAGTGNFSLRKLPVKWVFCAMTALVSIPAFCQEPNLNEANLTFVGADIESVIKAVGHYTGTTFIVDPRVKGTINLVTEKPVTKAQAFSLLTSTLRLQGYSVVTSNGFSKVVPESDGKLQAGPTALKGIKGDQIVTQVFHLNYENAGNLVTVLRPLISPNNTISASLGADSLVITDYADNVKRLGKIIAYLDVPATSEYEVIPLKHAIASDVATLLLRLTEQSSGPGMGLDSGKVVIIAESRTNSILMHAPTEARANLVKKLIVKLDQPTALPGNVHVVYLRNADALKLAQTLRAISAPDSSSSSSMSTSNGSSSNSSSANQSQSRFGATGSSGSSGFGGSSNGNSSGFGNSSGGGGSSLSSGNAPTSLPTGGAGGYIQADAATNTIIISASETVYRNLRPIIDQLDSRRAQVYIEALIIDVSTTDMEAFGVQWAGITGNANSRVRVAGVDSFNTLTGAGGASANLFSLAAAGSAAVPPPGFNLGILSSRLGLGAIASALETTGIANVLSVPTLTTLDNEEASVLVGQNVPLITGQFITPASSGTSGGNSSVNPFQTVERKDLGVILKVRPQISEGGAVKLTLRQEVSSIASQTNTAGIIFNTRVMDTSVIVDDGQVLVLGGLMVDDVGSQDDRVPILGDIPYLGNLFKAKTKTHRKANLLIFLRPTVLRNSDQGNSISVDRYDYMRAMVRADQPGEPLLNVPKLSAEYNSKLIPQTLIDREATPSRLDSLDGGGSNPKTLPDAPDVIMPTEIPVPAPVLSPTEPIILRESIH